jgi:heme/copper-type cytochrome/quinol oxidase subunit 2
MTVIRALWIMTVIFVLSTLVLRPPLPTTPSDHAEMFGRYENTATMWFAIALGIVLVLFAAATTFYLRRNPESSKATDG